MTKKDFELIARVLDTVANKTYIGNEKLENVYAKKFADELEKVNPRFNREKFLQACTPAERKL